MNANQETSIIEGNTQELRTASSLRFVFTKKQKEIKVVDIKKPSPKTPGDEIPKADKKPPGRRQIDSENSKRKAEKAQEEAKKMKAEWGKAYRSVADGKEPTYPVFLEISATEECSSDPFYLKMFREMAYGSFPKGIFYDSNRDTMVCTEPPSKKNVVVRKQRMEKYIRVCLPLRPLFDVSSDSTMTRNTSATNEEQPSTFTNPELLPSMDQQEFVPPSYPEESVNVEQQRAEEDLQTRRVLRYIHRSYQRLELPVLVLRNQFKMAPERIYQEIKLFIYIMIDILSPKDSVRLQEDSYQMILSGELVTSLKPQKTWKKLSQLEQVSLLCQYCRSMFVKIEEKRMDEMNLAQMKILREIEECITGLYLTGCISQGVIEFNGYKVTEIKGIEITSHGVRIDRSTLFANFKYPSEPDTVAPVVFQKFKVVGLQKISNGIAKQGSKFSKLINDLTMAEES